MPTRTSERPPAAGSPAANPSAHSPAAVLRRDADRLLREVARAHAVPTLLAAGATLAGSALVLLLPDALARAVDAVTGPSGAAPHGAVLAFAVLLAALTCTDLVAEFAAPYSGAAATATLRRRVLGRLLAAGPAATRRFPAGDLVGRLVGAAPEAANAPAAVVGAVADLVTAAGGIAALGLIDWRLALAFAATVPLGALILRSFVRQTGDLAAGYQRVQGEIAARLLDALAGVRTIRASGTREAEAARVLAPLPRLGALGRALWRSQRTAGWQSTALYAVTQTTVLSVAGWGLADGRLAVGQVLAAMTYAALGLGFFGSTQAALALARARGAARRLAEVDALTGLEYGVRALPPGFGELRLSGVTVHGPDGPVLDRLELTVPGGTALAVVGPAGAGKSTLAALAGRLVDPDEGAVRLDGVPLPRLTRESLRAAVGYAFERPAPLGATVRETVGLGAPPDRVEAAARAAAAHGFIRRLPEGYDTPLERAPLSGGETQRLGLARALARGGERLRVLVLDDATAALDTVTEAQVSGAVERAAAGRTRLLIAHRPSTAARADLVVWLDGGRLRALAPHRELWQDPEYRALLGGDDEADGESGGDGDG
jgi:ATP-binding cassette subfamily B protein